MLERILRIVLLAVALNTVLVGAAVAQTSVPGKMVDADLLQDLREVSATSAIELDRDGCIIYYYRPGHPAVKRFDACIFLGMTDFNLDPLPNLENGIQDIQRLDDGGLLVANSSVIARFDSTGRLTARYDIPGDQCWSGFALSPGELSFWASSSCGAELVEFPLGGPARPFRIVNAATHQKSIETTLAGKMFGGGSEVTTTGGQVNHGMNLNCDVGVQPNYLQVVWNGSTVFFMEEMTSASCTNDPVIDSGTWFNTFNGTGNGTIDGQPGATVEWTLTDAGQPGVLRDTARIRIRDASGQIVLEVAGKIFRGSHIAIAQ